MPSIKPSDLENITCIECQSTTTGHFPDCSLYAQSVKVEWIHSSRETCPTCGEPIDGYGYWQREPNSWGSGPMAMVHVQYCSAECAR